MRASVCVNIPPSSGGISKSFCVILIVFNVNIEGIFFSSSVYM